MDKFENHYQTNVSEEDVNKMLGKTTDDVERQLAHQEQMGGSLASTEPGRFIFTFNPYVDRHSEKMGVRERHYTANLVQVGNFIPQQRLSAALQDSVYRALQNLIVHERIPDQDRVYFNLSSNRLTNSYGYRGLSASEWFNRSDRVDNLLQQMSRMLNSNENFEMNDSFQLSFTRVRGAPKGSGRKRKLKPGHTHPETFKRIKQSVISIKNKDQLCCARAIGTAKAKVDNHPNWYEFQKGTKSYYITRLTYPLIHVSTTSYKNLL